MHSKTWDLEVLNDIIINFSKEACQSDLTKYIGMYGCTSRGAEYPPFRLYVGCRYEGERTGGWTVVTCSNEPLVWSLALCLGIFFFPLIPQPAETTAALNCFPKRNYP